MSERCRAALAVFALLLLCAVAPPTSWAAAPKTGKLKLTVDGLPKGTSADVLVTSRGRSHHIRRTSSLGGLRSGTWTVRVRKVRIAKSMGAVKRGAVAQPSRSRFTVQVSAGSTALATVSYPTIANAPAKPLNGQPTRVVGDPLRPTAVVLPKSAAPAPGQYVTAGPSQDLPGGLIARVTGSRAVPDGREVGLEHVPVTELFPSFQVDAAIEGIQVATRAETNTTVGLGGEVKLFEVPGFSCGAGASAALSASARLSTPRLQADVRVSPLGGPKADVTVTARPTVKFTASAARQVFCEAEIAPTKIVGAVPIAGVPVPVYVSLPLKARAEFSSETEISSAISWDLRVGMRTERKGAALIPYPVLDASNPQKQEEVRSTPAFTFTPSIGFEIGLGVRGALAFDVSAQTSVPFTKTPSDCSWDLKLETFKVTRTTGPVSFGTTPLRTYSHRLWTGCQRAGGGPAGGTPVGGSTSGPTPGDPAPGGPTSPEPGGWAPIAMTHVAESGDPAAAYAGPPIPDGLIIESRYVGAGRDRACYLPVSGELRCLGYDGMTTWPGRLVEFDMDTGGGFCGLTAERAVSCPGRAVPSGQFRQVSVGRVLACGIRENYVLSCWHWDGTPAPEDTPPSGRYVRVSVGGTNVCALRVTSKVECWGRDFYTSGNTLVPPNELYRSISVGSASACGVRLGGTLDCWGYNGSQPDVHEFGVQNVIQLTVGLHRACALRADSRPWCFNPDPGTGAPRESNPPDDVSGDVTIGDGMGCAVPADRGSMRCWGGPFAGFRTAPVGSFKRLSMDGYDGCAISTSTSSVSCWGRDDGLPNLTLAGQYKQVSQNGGYFCGIRLDSTLACNYGESAIPPPAGTYVDIASNSIDTCAIRASDRGLVCWSYYASPSEPAPQPPDGAFTKVVALVSTTSTERFCGLRTEGTIICWERPGSSEVLETGPPGGGSFIDVDAGEIGVCAIRATVRTLLCWPSKRNYAAPTQTPSGSFTEVAVGYQHACGLRDDATVTCWGDNTYGQRTAPAGAFTEIDAGRYRTCGVRPGGSVECWGDGTFR